MCGFRKLTPHGTFGGSYPTVDAFGSWRRILADLEANVVEKRRLGQVLLGDGGGVARSRPPAEEMEEVVGITTQRGIGYATNSLLVQISIDPPHVPTGRFDHAERTV